MSNRSKVYSANRQIQDIIYQAESGEIGWGDALDCIKSVGEKLSPDNNDDTEEE